VTGPAAASTALGSSAPPRITVDLGTVASRRTAIFGLALLVILASLPAWGTAGQMRFLVEVLTMLALAQMWNLLAGYAGLVSIGQQAFIGLGAYGLFISADIVGLPPVAAVVVVAGAAAAVAFAISPLVFRLGGGYFAIGTWVMAEVVRLIVVQFRELGAGTGVSVGPLVAMPAGERQVMIYWLALAVGFGSVVVVALIMRSRLGMALTAVRDSEIAASSVGVDVARAKLAIWLIAAVGCAVAGTVFYMQSLRIQPTAAFGIEWTAVMIFIVIIGGVGRIEGPIVGTIVFYFLQSQLAALGALYLVILGSVAVFITLFVPGGLWGALTARRPISLFATQRRLVVDRAPPPASQAAAGGST
jgi:branched-chain amino acid transport system permease protein